MSGLLACKTGLTTREERYLIRTLCRGLDAPVSLWGLMTIEPGLPAGAGLLGLIVIEPDAAAGESLLGLITMELGLAAGAGLAAGLLGTGVSLNAGLAAGAAAESLIPGFFFSSWAFAAPALNLTRSGRISSRLSTGNMLG